MSGEYDDLLAAFNIPIAGSDGQSSTSNRTVVDDKPSTSPRKLALNGNASTSTAAAVAAETSEDEDGWIIDEGGPTDGRVKTAPDPAGRAMNGRGACGEQAKGARRKRPPPTAEDSGGIPASFTPMQGWKASTSPAQTYGLPGRAAAAQHATGSADLLETDGAMTMPVIDPKSVVSRAAVPRPARAKTATTAAGDPKARPPTDNRPTISAQLAKRLVNPGRDLLKIFRPSVPTSAYGEYDAPSEGFNCRSCGCRFLVKGSLLAHLKRPSFIISYRCELCPDKRLHKFYNKCALWLHLMSHSKDVLKNCDKLTRTVKLQPFTKTGFLSYDFGANCPKELKDFGRFVDSEANIQCPACLTEIDHGSRDGLAKHLGVLDLPNMKECPSCRRLLKNSCEELLHRFMHDDGRYCPGCGIEHVHELDYYHHAQSSGCLYWLSLPLIVCAMCLQPHHDLDMYTEHLCTHHSLCYYKCTCCQLAFRNFGSLSQHLYDQHRPSMAKQKPPMPSRQQILKCPLCKNVFSGGAAVKAHLLEVHAGYLMKRVQKFIYRCSLCPHLRNFFDRHVLAAHMRGVHPGLPFPALCDLCGKAAPSFETLKQHRAACARDSQQQPKASSKRGSEREPKKRCWGNLPTRTKRVLRCSRCPPSDKVFYSVEASYEAHFRAAHGASGAIAPPIAVDLVTANNGPAVPRVAADRVARSAAVRPTGPSGAAPLKRPVGPVGRDGREAKKAKVVHRTPLSCSKCEFSSNDRGKFQEHIKTHKVNDSHQQCQECGLCFRSRTALVRHMAMKHRIRTPLAAAVMPRSSPVVARSPAVKAKPATAKVEAPPPPKAACPRTKAAPEAPDMECTVCYRTFATDLLLRNHMRTHGMAFIRSKRTSSKMGGT